MMQKENGNGEAVVELSVEETNKLRKELGLPPLRQQSAVGGQAVHKAALADNPDDPVLEMSVDETNQLRASLGLAPLRATAKKNEPQYVNPAEAVEAQRAKERLENAKLKRAVEQGYQTFDSALATQPAKAATSWAQQMLKGKKEDSESSESRRKKKSKRVNDTEEKTFAYNSSDLKGLTVAHSLNDFSGDSTTILTLQDAPLIDKAALNEGEVQLENINLTEARKVSDGLREKRKVEMGMGRTNGYAGFDDDEFEELGGTQGPSRMARGQAVGEEAKAVKVRGFRIGSAFEDDEGDDDEGHPHFGNKAISLETRADVTAADFMTMEEDEQLRQKKKKDKKFKRTKKKKDKKNKKRQRSIEQDSEDEQQPQLSLLDALEDTAVEIKKKEDSIPSTSSSASAKESVLGKRDRYDSIMDKGNQRSRKAFEPVVRSTQESSFMDEEPDDAFLNAALAKARRLKKLKDMQRGASAVTDSLKRQAKVPEIVPSSDATVFETNEISEFTRALQARSTQTKRTAEKKKSKDDESLQSKLVGVVEDVEMTDAGDEKIDLHELSKDIKEDPLPDGHNMPHARGVGGILEILKGDLSQKHAGREALRGRAKDERNYEDYAPLNLSEVVKIDERNATKLDKELASREVKLEYRDKHGRLLTRKEAYRELCYQFHGHGSGKRKEQKKLEQISREQAEARLVQESATMGALQATQKATGKAYVVHKSGKS